MQQETLINIWQSASPWILSSGLRIIVILVGAYILHRYGVNIIAKVIRKAVRVVNHISFEAEKKREDTLIRVFTGTFKVLVIIMAVMMALSEAGMNIGPLMAVAGIAGISFGFGGQYLIRDIISGLFIIIEDQYRVGDVVRVGGLAGVVESITIRMTILRDLDGVVHYVPNGEVATASNMTKLFGRVNLNIGVAYDTDIEKAIKVINKVGEGLANDLEWRDKIVKAPQFLRVDEFADSAIMLKILGDTKPIEQWAVMGELRKRLKLAFDKEKITIPFPQRVVHFEGEKPSSKRKNRR